MCSAQVSDARPTNRPSPPRSETVDCRLEDLKKEIDALKTEVVEVTAEKSLVEGEKMALENTIVSNKRKIDELNDSLIKANKQINIVTANNEKLDKMIEAKTEELTVSYRKCATLQETIVAKEEENVQSKKTIDELNDKCHKLVEKIRDEENKKALEQQRQAMLDVINTAIASNNTAQRIKREKERENERIQRERKRRLVEEKTKCIVM